MLSFAFGFPTCNGYIAEIVRAVRLELMLVKQITKSVSDEAVPIMSAQEAHSTDTIYAIEVFGHEGGTATLPAHIDGVEGRRLTVAKACSKVACSQSYIDWLCYLHSLCTHPDVRQRPTFEVGHHES